MIQTIASVTLVVRDYDEAIGFFTGRLGFKVIVDTPLGEGKRWILVAPANSHGASLLLAQASTSEQASRIGNQTGGRVFLFLHTDDFWRDYRQMKAQGIEFRETPRDEPYGTVAVFEDLYGNQWDLLEVKRNTDAVES
jgi:catechol 2,3-dioxygenase-like lactoylglutathione lyase family enzyme